MAASASKKASNTPAWLNRQKRFQTEFQLPNSAGSARPGDVVDAEVVHRFQEPAVVPTLVAPARAEGSEHLNHSVPVLVRHPCQHGRPPPNRPARNQKIGVPGIPSAPDPPQSVHTA